jgi:hypothetical protein
MTGRQGLTNLEKIGIGLVLSIVGMAAAAIWREEAPHRVTVAATSGGSGHVSLPISVLMSN